MGGRFGRSGRAFSDPSLSGRVIGGTTQMGVIM